MYLMENIKDFLNSDEIKNLFMINGYNLIIIDNEIYLENKNKKITEVMSILGDENNTNRIRFKGTNFAFSINTNKKGNFYLDHLLIGNIEQDEYDFIMRNEVIDEKNKITIKLVDDKNVKHIYKIKDDAINIDRISIRKEEYNDEDLFEEEEKEDKILQKYEIEHFHLFKGKENQIIIGNQDQEYTNNCLKEFLILEKSFIGITPYIEKRILFLSEAINTVSNSESRLYQIKGETKAKKPYIPREKTKIYNFTREKTRIEKNNQ